MDRETMTEAEREAWDERVAICMEDGLVSREQAEAIADDQIRRMRERSCNDT